MSGAAAGGSISTAQELKKLAEAATPGPWWFRDEQWQADLLAPTRNPDQIAVCPYTSDDEEYDAQIRSDFAYLAALPPETVLALLDVVEAAQTYRDAVEGGREDAGIALQVTYRSLAAALARLEALPAPAVGPGDERRQG